MPNYKDGSGCGRHSLIFTKLTVIDFASARGAGEADLQLHQSRSWIAIQEHNAVPEATEDAERQGV